MTGSALKSLTRRGALALVGSTVWLAACSESPVPPLAPSSVPSERVQGLALNCPVNVSRQSFDGGPVRVQFGAPRAQGGLEPVTTKCMPRSGAAFPLGTSMVTCSAEDDLQQTASCSLTVTVVPTLTVDTILAFGDSLTAGVRSSVIPTVVTLDPGSSYPAQLGRLLDQRYTRQRIRVVNSGVPGEDAAEAISRFQSELLRVQPDVVLLMEGTNDLSPTSSALGEAGAAAIETMIRDAKARGVDPIVATIPPQRTSRGTEPMVVPYNDLIRQIAIRQGVPLVDVFRVISRGQCLGFGSLIFSCLGDDDLHPTTQGYGLIAAEFFQTIMDLYEPRPRGAGGSSALTQAGDPLGPAVLR